MNRRKHKLVFNFLTKIIIASVCITFICIFFYNADTNTSFYNYSNNNNSVISEFMPDHNGKFVLYVMNTGNSDSLLLIDPSGQAILIDAAEDDDFNKIKTTLIKFEVEKINALIATHPHADHIGSMDEVISCFKVDAIYMTRFSDNTKVTEDLMNAVESSGIQEIFVDPGMKIKLGNTSIHVLGPEERGTENNTNDESIVLLVSYGQMDFLLTGDMEEKESREILERWGKNVDCEVLKVAHHGSKTGTSKEFLEAATPDIAVISCGENNPYGHPDEETLALLDDFFVKTLRTDRMGDIAVLTDGQTVETCTEYAQ